MGQIRKDGTSQTWLRYGTYCISDSAAYFIWTTPRRLGGYSLDRQESSVDTSGLCIKANKDQPFDSSAVASYFPDSNLGRTLSGETVDASADRGKGDAPDI
jgi:hypothetical protein